MTSSEYLNLVNREESADEGPLTINYVKMGEGYFAYALTPLGKIVSPSFHRASWTDEEIDGMLDEATKDIVKEHERLKEKQITAGLLTFNTNKLKQL